MGPSLPSSALEAARADSGCRFLLGHRRALSVSRRSGAWLEIVAHGGAPQWVVYGEKGRPHLSWALCFARCLGGPLGIIALDNSNATQTDCPAFWPRHLPPLHQAQLLSSPPAPGSGKIRLARRALRRADSSSDNCFPSKRCKSAHLASPCSVSWGPRRPGHRRGRTPELERRWKLSPASS